MCSLKMGDEDVEWVLKLKIYAQLPEELQMGFTPSNLEGMLRYKANFSKVYRTAEDIAVKLKQEAGTMNPALIWQKFQVYLCGIRPKDTKEEIAEEAWSMVRDNIYKDTPYHPYVCSLIDPPADQELKVANAVWRSVMKPESHLLGYVGKTTNKACDAMNNLDSVRRGVNTEYSKRSGYESASYDKAWSAELFRKNGMPAAKNGYFRYECHNCGEIGHRRENCGKLDTGWHEFRPRVRTREGTYERSRHRNGIWSEQYGRNNRANGYAHVCG